MAKFKPGDLVIRIQETGENLVPVGSVGTFLEYNENWMLRGYFAAKVCWDEEVPCGEGHTCGGLCEHGFGWQVPEQDLEHCASDPIDESDYDTSDITAMINSMFGGESV